MKIQSRLAASIVVSLLISIAIVSMAFFVLRDAETELERGRVYDEAMAKANALNVLFASLQAGANQDNLQQIMAVHASLGKLLDQMSPDHFIERQLIGRIKQNNEALGLLLGHISDSVKQESQVSENEQKEILGSQIWMKVRQIADEVQQLRDRSRDRMVSAHSKSGIIVVALLIALILSNMFISIIAGRNIIQSGKSLRESEERFRSTLDSMMDGCQIIGFDWTYLYINDSTARQSRRSKEELLGRKMTDAWPGIETTEIFVLLQRSMEERVTIEQEIEYVFPDGNKSWFHVKSQPVSEGIFVQHSETTEERMAQEALVESEEKFRSFSEQSLTGIYIIQDGVFKYVNPKFAEIFGYTVEEILSGLSFEKLVHPDDLAMATSQLKARESGEQETSHNTARGIRKNGKIIHVEIFGFSMMLDGKKAATGTLLDITERVRAEEALAQSEHRHLSFFQANPMWTTVATLAEGRFIETNPAFHLLSGYTSEDTLGRTSIEMGLWPDPSLRADAMAELESQGSLSGFPITMRMKNGDTRDLLWHAVATDVEGEPCLLSVLVDITEHNIAETALRKSEERYRSTLDNMMEGCQIIGFDWTYLYLNQAAAIQNRRPNEELLGRKMPEMWPGIVDTEVFAMFRRTMEERVTLEKEIDFVFPDGSRNWFSAKSQPVPEGIFILHSEITERKKAEAALRENEARFRAFFENSMAGMLIWDTGDPVRYVAINQTLADINGRPVSEHIGKTIGEVFDDPESVAELEKRTKNVIETREPVSFEARGINQQGQLIQYAADFFPLYDSGGNLVGIGSVVKDITHIKSTEEELSERNRFIESIINSSPDVLYLYDIVKRENVYSSRGIEEVLGYSTEEIVEMGNEILAYLMHPDDFTFYLQNTYPKYQKVPDNVAINHQYRMKHKDGKWRWIDCTEYIYSRDSDGAPRIVFGAARDVSKQKSSEFALKASEERFKRSLENIPDVVVIYDPDLRIRYINAATRQLTGQDTAYFIGKRDDEVWPPEMYQTYLPTLVESAESKVMKSIETELLLPNGQRRYLNITCVPLTDEQGELLEILGITHDLTGQKLAEETRISLQKQLNQAQKLEAIGTLAGGIAHDFNNILTAQLGFTKLALDQVQDNPDLTYFLEQAETAGLRASQLVKQILRFSRQSRHEMQPIKISSVVKEALKLLRASIPSYIDIVSDIRGDDYLVMADPAQIHQIVMNLCTNAVHAMRDKKGTLHVQLRATGEIADSPPDRQNDVQGKYLCLTVKDDGHGMPAETTNKIFDPFFTTKGKTEGTGLGLSVVYGIVKDHGGEIRVRSELNVGTAFDVYLPITKAAGKKDASRVPNEESLGGSEHILIVDDEKVIVEVLGETLKCLGYKVTTCTSSKDALQLIQAAPDAFDLLITDYTMPEMTGEALAIEAMAANPELPTVLCTGFSARIDKDKARQLGIDAMLMKPVPKLILTETIRALLDKRSAKAKSEQGHGRWPFSRKLTLLVADDDEDSFDSFHRDVVRRNAHLIHVPSGDEAVKIFSHRHEEIDAVLLDLGMPGMGGREALHKIWDIDPSAKIIIVSGFGSQEQHREFYDERLVGFLDKPINHNRLVELLKKALSQPAKNKM